MTLGKFVHNFNGHLHTINSHRRLVRKYCFKVGLYRQGLMHDLSKYSPSEFFPGVKYYQDGHRSPNNAQREDKGGIFLLNAQILCAFHVDRKCTYRRCR